MRITAVTAHEFIHPMKNPPRNARTVWREKKVLLVKVETDAGIFGVGEAWCDGASVRATMATLEDDVAPRIIGVDPFLTERVFADLVDTTIVSGKRGIMHAAASAVDIALWDIKGKATGQPVYKLLGGHADRVFAYASGGLYRDGKTLEDLAAEVRGWVDQGFQAVKIKVGGADHAEDVARVHAVREAVGAKVQVMADALYGLSVNQAKRLSWAMEADNLEFFEAPVSSYDVRGLAELRRDTRIPIAGNEIEIGRHAFHRLMEERAVDVVHVEAVLCGGISEALKIAAIAAAYDLPVSFHNSSSVIAFAANLHAAAAIANCHSVEYHMVHRLLFDRVVSPPIEIADSHVLVPNRPGLGVELDPSVF